MVKVRFPVTRITRREDLFEGTQALNNTLPDGLFADRIEPIKTQNDEFNSETIEEAVGRFYYEGGRIGLSIKPGRTKARRFPRAPLSQARWKKN